MKFLPIVPMLLLVNCVNVETKPVAASQPASQQVVKTKPKINKFFLNYFKSETDEEDCTFLEAGDGEKMVHFLFMCGNSLVHLGIEKNK